MKTLALTLILNLFLISSISAQQDVKNWGNLPWNSTSSQILNKYKTKLIKLQKRKGFDKGYYSDYILKDYHDFNSVFTVHFVMDSNDNRLKRILLTSEAIKSKPKTSLKNATKIYETVLKAMEKQYGVPGTNKKDNFSNTDSWYFNSSIINLNLIHLKSINFTGLSIIYEKATHGFDFRKTKWGFSRKKVQESEKMTPIIDTTNILGYETPIAGMKCLIGYIFVNNKLTRAKYVFEEKHSNENDYIVDYHNLRDILNKKYGKSTSQSDGIWRDDLYKDDIQKWGFAVSLGDLYYFSDWQTQKTDIDLMLSGENYKISLVVEYDSKQFKGLEKKVKEKKIMSDF